MDLFQYLDDYQTWVCIACGYGVKLNHYTAHLMRCHTDHPKLGSSKKVRIVVEELMQKSPINPDTPCFQPPRAGTLALPYLPIYDGLGCLQCGYASSSETTMLKHCQKQHVECKRGRGRPLKAAEAAALRWKKVSYQRLFVAGSRSHFFAVIPPAEIQEEEETRKRQEMAHMLPEADYIRAQIEEVLEEGSRETTALENVILDNAAQTEVSPWLEMTRWPKYLHGYSFGEVAPLAAPADPISEPILAEFSESLDRIVEEAHNSICNDKVNVFDQARINSFIQRRRAWDRPLMTKLRKSTYREYKKVFQRLICFAYRTIQPGQRVALSHRLTTTQLAHFDQMIGFSEE